MSPYGSMITSLDAVTNIRLKAPRHHGDGAWGFTRLLLFCMYQRKGACN